MQSVLLSTVGAAILAVNSQHDILLSTVGAAILAVNSQHDNLLEHTSLCSRSSCLALWRTQVSCKEGIRPYAAESRRTPQGGHPCVFALPRMLDSEITIG